MTYKIKIIKSQTNFWLPKGLQKKEYRIGKDLIKGHKKYVIIKGRRIYDMDKFLDKYGLD